MNCPQCRQKTNISETENKYFVGRNSSGIPFFKCEECGNLFYLNETEGVAHLISRERKGRRFVPITCGLIQFLIAVLILYFFGSNILTWIVSVIFFSLGWSSMKIGILGSQKLLDEMILDRDVATSKKATEEWKKLNKLE